VDKTSVFEVWDSVPSYIMYCFVSSDDDGAGRLSCYYGTENVASAENSISLATWYRVGYSFQINAGASKDHAVSVVACTGNTQSGCSGLSHSWTEVDDDIADQSKAAATIAIGERYDGSNPVDSVKVSDFYVVSGYKGADPF
jgi:hypothetical protein